MTQLSELYLKNKETEKGKKVSVEMEKLEKDFTSVYDVATHYLCLLKKRSNQVKIQKY